MLARTSRKPSLTLLCAVALVVAVANPAAAPPGDLDTTFDGDGKVTTNFTAAVAEARGLAIQGDGKIVAAGRVDASGTRDFALARYNADGSLDTTFDGDGLTTTDFGAGLDFGYAVALPGDGKIVMAGYADVSGNREFALARYNADGSLDTTFGDGKVTTDFAGSSDVAWGMAIQGDGKIVVAGLANVAGTGDFALARYNADGSLDTTFDGDGKVTTDFDAGSSDLAYAVTLQGDGRIVAAGVAVISGTNDFALARYNTDGSLDTTFDGDGLTTTDFGSGLDQASAVAIQGDGKIVAVGRADISGAFDFPMARYNADGSLDNTFDTDGKVTTDFAGDIDLAYGVAIQGDGKIVAAGRAIVSGNRRFALARYLGADGSLDTNFSGDGKLTTDFAGSFAQAYGLAIQADGKIVAGGFAGADFALARYQSEGVGDLNLSKTGPMGRVPTGRSMTYTITVANNGPDASSGVTVTDQLPSTVTFVSATPSQGSCSESGGTVTCNLGAMGNGATATVDIEVEPTVPGAITNTASVTATTPDSNEGNNFDSENTSVCRITSRRSSIPCG